MSRGQKRAVLAAAILAALVLGGVSIAGATGGGDDDGGDRAITGGALDRAKAVALQHTGGGRVTATEVGDEEGYYEVEVTRGDGSQVDVHLNRDFEVLGGQADGDDGSRDGGSNDD
jgi:uncharacterized membrane protein YkoI